jgi:hypothetical protein
MYEPGYVEFRECESLAGCLRFLGEVDLYSDWDVILL